MPRYRLSESMYTSIIVPWLARSDGLCATKPLEVMRNFKVLDGLPSSIRKDFVGLLPRMTVPAAHSLQNKMLNAKEKYQNLSGRVSSHYKQA